MTPFDALLVLVGGFLVVGAIELSLVVGAAALIELRERRRARRRPQGEVIEFLPSCRRLR